VNGPGEDDAPRVQSLDGVRADGWLERLVAERDGLAEMVDVVGRPFAAFAFVAGVRINALAGDLSAPESTLVDFQVGDDPEEQRLGLNEFRRRLAAALLSDDHLPPPLPADHDPDDAALQAFLGPQTLLLAPVFGMRLEALVRKAGALPVVRLRRVTPELSGAAEDATAGDDDDEGDEGLDGVGGATGEVVDLPVEELRELIRDGIQQAVERFKATSAVSIELSVLPEAEAALTAGNAQRTIALLGAWPGPLTMLLRTPQAAELDPQVRMTLGRALGFLGTAYVETGRFEWSEEVLRLGIQYVQEGAGAGDLYHRLGGCFAAQDRLGEAIGPLRRAVALGVPEPRVLPTLARAYAAIGRHVAAVATAERALDASDPDAHDEMARIRDASAEALGTSWNRFADRFPTRPPLADQDPD